MNRREFTELILGAAATAAVPLAGDSAAKRPDGGSSTAPCFARSVASTCRRSLFPGSLSHTAISAAA